MGLPEVKDDLVQFSEMIFMYRAALKEITTRLNILNDECMFVNKYEPIKSVFSRIKSIESISNKLIRKGKNVTLDNIQNYINDIAGVRVICQYEPDIYRVVDILTNQNDIEVIKSKDYLIDPMTNGYRSYHLTVAVPICLAQKTVKTKVEIQLRTASINAWAEMEQCVYDKYSSEVPEYIINELKECSDIVKYLDNKMLKINEEVKRI